MNNVIRTAVACMVTSAMLTALTSQAQKKPAINETEINKEVSASKNTVIHIDNSGRNLEVHVWNQPKVKIVTKVNSQSEENLNSDEWFEKLGITLKSLNNRIEISSKRGNSIYGNGYSYGFLNGNMDNINFNFNFDSLMPARTFNFDSLHFDFKFDSLMDGKLWKLDSSLGRMQIHLDSLTSGKWWNIDTVIIRNGKRDTIRINGFINNDTSNHKRSRVSVNRLSETQRLSELERGISMQNEGRLRNLSRNPINEGNKKQTLVIYVPQGSKLDIDNQYTNIVLFDDYAEANFKLKNSTLDARKIKKLTMVAKYSTVNMGDVENAEIEFQNGKLIAQNIQELDIESKASSIEYESGNSLIIRSQNDDYNIESLHRLSGRKSYGDLRINKLSGSIDLEGKNADLRVRNLLTSVDKISIIDKYADIRLPVRNLQNYTVDFSGKYTTVFAPFEKIAIRDTTSSRPGNTYTYNGTAGAVIYNATPAQGSLTKFTSAVGNIKKSHTEFKLTCDQCTVDFK